MDRVLNATPDVPDARDRMYEPALVALPAAIAPDVDPRAVLDQGREGACAGFALAAAVGRLARQAGRPGRPSARMLYEMAKRCDEWPGEAYAGTSLRGAIRGFKNHGVCTEAEWPFRDGRPGHLTVARAKAARKTTLGAYYRVRPVVSDVHAALVEAGVVVVSARVHAGWRAPERVIRPGAPEGAHAFAVVGYDAEGFWVQSSWGRAWGAGGLALWTYEDWAAHVMDAWVLRLARPTPQVFGRAPSGALVVGEALYERAGRARVPRMEIAGHFVHVDDGRFHAQGKYWSDANDVRETARLLAGSTDYDHLLVYAHGGLTTPDDASRLVRAVRDGCKRNRVYPYHLMYETGLVEELFDLVRRRGGLARERVGGLREGLDRFLEGLVRRPGGALWGEMKRSARTAFGARAAGTRTLRALLEAVRTGARPKRVHLVGHSLGGVLVAHLLHALRDEPVEVATCTLLAPAATLALYASHVLPALAGTGGLVLGDLEVINLSDTLERADDVAGLYGKSVLYLVSNALEGDAQAPLLGLARFAPQVDDAGGRVRLVESDGARGTVTQSRRHTDFDRDVTTWNHVLARILGEAPTRPFTATELEHGRPRRAPVRVESAAPWSTW